MVGTPIAVNSRGLDGGALPAGRRRLARSVGIALGIVALGASAAFLIGLLENPSWASSGPSARALPADLFAPPAAPKPRIVVRYLAPRNPASDPVASATALSASPTPSARHRPSPSPSPRGGDD